MVPLRCPTRRGQVSVKGRRKNCCNWSKLPDDLLVEILRRLPENKLGRFKTVCKSWNDLITNACMPKIFASTPLSGYIFTAITGKYEPSLDYKNCKPTELPLRIAGPVAIGASLLPFIPSAADFLGFCNGLQLFIYGSSQQYYVCNAATRQCVAIPICSEARNFSFNSLAFDPCRSLHFKLICFDRVRPCISYYIFSSDTCRWDMHQVSLEHPATGHSWHKQCVYSNGVLYRLSESKHLISLDISRINACAIDLPEMDTTHISGLTVERGHLYYSNHDGINICIWKLKSYSYSDAGSWIFIHKICLRNLYTSPWHCRVRDFSKTPCFIDYPTRSTCYLIFAGTPEMVVTYDLNHHRCSHWRMKEKECMAAFGQYTFWPHRCYWGLISLKYFHQ